MNELPTHPDLILYNAKIYTVEPAQPWVQAVAIRQHQRIAIGDTAEVLALAGPTTQLLDLGGKLVLPGLCDAHIHFIDWSLGQHEVGLADCASKADMLERIAQRAAASTADAWITGQGWNESRWGETRFPTVADLDAVTGPEQPALFWRSDMHVAIVNSAAMRVAGITAGTPNRAGGVIEKDGAGQPNGVFKELAIHLITKHIPQVQGAAFEAALRDGIRHLHRLGVTAIHDQRLMDSDDGPRALAAYQQLHRTHQLKLRVNCNIAAHNLPHLAALGLQSGFGDDYLRLGHVKIFADGSLGSRTAWLLEPFEKQQADEPDNYGVSVTPPDQMARQFRQALELGFPISVHAIGDYANHVCLDIFEELASSGLHPVIPNRIEHVQTIAPADLPRLAQLGITASVQPIHALDVMDTVELTLGARGAYTYTFHSLLEQGTRLAFGSDAPVANANPFLGFHAAICRQRVNQMSAPPWYGNEQISLEATIHGYTKGAAQAAGWEQVIGSIALGKRADLIVLDRNLFELVERGVTSGEIAETQVLMTFFDGELVYQA